MPPTTKATDAVLKELREFGLRYPGAHTKSPWPGHLDLAVNDKTFAYLSLEGEPLGISCKLPHSNAVALLLPFTEPAGYGLGKSGWVAAKFPEGEVPPIELLKSWIDESYRAQAPKKLVASLPPAEGGRGTNAPATPAKAPSPKKAGNAAAAPEKTGKAAVTSRKAGKAAAAAPKKNSNAAAASKRAGKAVRPTSRPSPR